MRLSTKFEPTLSVEVSASDLAKAIKYALPAVSKDSQRHSIHGISFDVSPHGLLAIAGTDSRRLHVTELSVAETGDLDAQCWIIDVPTAKMLLVLCQQAKGAITINYDSATRETQFRNDNYAELRSLNVPGRYPIWRDCVPQSAHQITLGADLVRRLHRDHKAKRDEVIQLTMDCECPCLTLRVDRLCFDGDNVLLSADRVFETIWPEQNTQHVSCSYDGVVRLDLRLLHESIAHAAQRAPDLVRLDFLNAEGAVQASPIRLDLDDHVGPIRKSGPSWAVLMTREPEGKPIRA